MSKGDWRRPEAAKGSYEANFERAVSKRAPRKRRPLTVATICQHCLEDGKCRAYDGCPNLVGGCC